jgi:hypothetical protein
MAQHDMNIANQGFPAFRSDLNDALAALVSNSSGATAPSTTFAHQMWVDTAANPSVLKIRNADNDAWITVGTIDQTGDKFVFSPASGSVSQVAYGVAGEIDTGMFFPASDTVAIATGGVESARVVSGLLSIPANSTAASAVRLYEDTDNGTNYVDIIAPASLTADRTLTLPDNTGTIITTGSTFAGTGPAFYAYKDNGTQNVTSGTFTKITFNGEVFDTNSNFASSTFTPTVAGYYQVNGSFSTEGIGTVSRQIVSIYKNGSEYLRNDLNGNGFQIITSGLVYCNGTTDYLDLYCNISGSGTLGVRGGDDGIVYTYFQASLVRAS